MADLRDIGIWLVCLTILIWVTVTVNSCAGPTITWTFDGVPHVLKLGK